MSRNKHNLDDVLKAIGQICQEHDGKSCFSGECPMSADYDFSEGGNHRGCCVDRLDKAECRATVEKAIRERWENEKLRG